MKLKEKLFITLCLSAVATMAGADDGNSAKALQLLSEVKYASGGSKWDSVKSITQKSKFVRSSEHGESESITDLPNMLNIQMAKIGPAIDTLAWDGKAAWSTDASKQIRLGTGKLSIATGIAQAYRASYAFFWPQRWPAIFAYTGEKRVNESDYDIVTVTPKGSDSFEIWIDKVSHLIAREVDIGGAQPHTLTLGDYQKAQGVLLPTSIRDSIGDEKFDTVSTTSNIVSNVVIPSKKFARPNNPSEPDPFPKGKSRIALPFQLIDNHIYIKASINGSKPQLFVFDTGAVAILDKSHAQTMDLQSNGNLAGSGFGDGVAVMNMAKSSSIDIHGFVVKNQPFLTMDISPISKAADMDIVGILGFELPQRTIMEIDYEKGILTLIKPSKFVPSKDAIAIPLKFNEQTPVIDASVDNIFGEFEIDTGSSSALKLMAPFSEKNHLIERYNATRKVQTGGAGGAEMNVLTRIAQLKIGSFSIEKPFTEIAIGDRGAGASTKEAGNIGNGILRQFVVTLDYGHQKLYLKPNPFYSNKDVYDRSGLRLRRTEDGGISVSFVVEGSGADNAGIKKGDRIVEIDGIQAKDVNLSDLRIKFKSASGTKIHLLVQNKNDSTQNAILVLNDLI